MKPTKYILLLSACLIISGSISHAQLQAVGGPATNVVTLSWDAPTNSTVPYTYQVHQATSLDTNAQWVIIAANIPSNITFLKLNVDKEFKAFKVRNVNQTNVTWVGDFSNVASTAWPEAGGNLAIRLGP